MKDAEGWVFPQASGVDSGRAGGEKARSQGVSCGQLVAASAVPWPRHGAVGASGGCWSAYGMGSRVAESRYGTGEMGLWGTLRAGVMRGLGSGSSRGARMAVERVP